MARSPDSNEFTLFYSGSSSFTYSIVHAQTRDALKGVVARHHPEFVEPGPGGDSPRPSAWACRSRARDDGITDRMPPVFGDPSFDRHYAGELPRHRQDRRGYS